MMDARASALPFDGGRQTASFVVWVLSPWSSFVCLVVGPVGKWETRLHRVFHFSIRAGSPFFFASFFFTNNLRFHRLFHTHASSSGVPTIAIGCDCPPHPRAPLPHPR